MTLDRPALPAVQSATTDAVTTADAMERLVSAEVLPAAFVGDVSRAFVCRECGDGGRDDYDEEQGLFRPCATCGGDVSRPVTMPDLVAWASLGAATILRAEELARDTACRLAPWGVALRPRRVVWRVAMPAHKPPVGWPRQRMLTPDLDAVYARRRSLRGQEPSLLAWANAHVDVWPAALPPCPWSPLAELLAMGLHLDAITDDALVVVVPPLGDAP